MDCLDGYVFLLVLLGLLQPHISAAHKLLGG